LTEMPEQSDSIRRPRKRRRALRRLATTLVLLLVVEYLVVPQIAGARKALSLLAHLNLVLVGLGVFLEAASLLSYAQLTRAVLPRSSAPSFVTITRIDLSTLAVSHVVPGGSAVGTGIGFRLLVRAGIGASDAGFALATQGIGSAVVLNVLLWVALAASIPLYGFNRLYGTAAIVGVVLIGGFSGIVLLLTRGEARAAKVLRTIARKVPLLDEEKVHQLVHRLAARLRAMAADRAVLSAAIGWAAANWILDAACLWVFLTAFGGRVGVDALLVSYGLANVLAAIPITPGGLGVVEAVLTSSLVGFGLPRGIAILGVIGYRLVNFWLPIPIGAVTYLSLRGKRTAPRSQKKEELGKLVKQATRSSQDPKTWAAEHGIVIERKG
jgi:uncharacterized protein (TIRG00374 family)